MPERIDGSTPIVGRSLSRRHFGSALLATPLAAEVIALGGLLALSPTPACGEDHAPTPSQTEGPFFTPKSPERADFVEEGMKGDPLWVEGRVFSTEGAPVPKALLDFWHADADGNYDNEGFRCRGHLFADEEGRFRLKTIRPGMYPGRTPHVHVKVQAPHGKILTTQLYFPNEPRNETDRIFNPKLLMRMKEEDLVLKGEFDFVLVM
ncbi:MAG: intradiol ring-cleavage dioxygenase [Candidatus Omnitrophica bacterium]|nr:hypothetical protein [bacterium]NUN95721.1 intradiol ring-cleavage dioxygenase [Candidatus Omnitrophota bacterium]